MKKKIFLAFLTALSLVGCATQQLTPEEQEVKELEKRIKPQNLDLINVKVNYSGAYKITENDKKLMNTYHRRYINKIFKQKKYSGLFHN